MILIVSCLILGSVYSSAAQSSKITPNAFALSVNPNNITVTQGDAINLTANFFEDGIAIANGWFQFRDPNQVFELDIGESQDNHENGTYTIFISENATRDALPSANDIFLEGWIGSELQAEVAITITIIAVDTINPTLIITQPSSFENFSESVFKLELNGTDETGWRDLSFNIGTLNIFYLKNSGVEIDQPNMKFNQTHLWYNDWVNLLTFEDINASDFRVIFRDNSFNTASFNFDLDGDYVKPIISWTSHSQEQIITSKTITLRWTIFDDSPIVSQELQLDHRTFKPGDRGLTIEDRFLTFNLPIDDQGVVLIFGLIVIDEANNRAVSELRIIFDPTIDKDDDIDLRSIDVGNNQETFLLGGFVLFLLIGITFVAVKLKTTSSEFDEKPTFKAKIGIDSVQKTLAKIPLPILDDSSVNPDVKTEISIQLSTAVQNVLTSSKESLEFEMNDLKNKIDYLEYEYSGNEIIIDYVNRKLRPWFDTIREKLG